MLQGGLASYENRMNDHIADRAFVTVQSLKKMEKHLRDWALETKGWKLVNFKEENVLELSQEEYDLASVDNEKYHDALFCRERWVKVGKKGEELAKKVNRGGMHFTHEEIIGTLQDMNFVKVAGEGYIPTYTRSDLTNNLHGSAGFRTDTQIVSKQKMKKNHIRDKKFPAEGKR